MRPRQILVVFLCFLLTAVDGFDVLSIGFAGPGISSEWKLGSAALGTVLAAELFGIAAGSILLGRLADRIGRRPIALGALALMTITMAAVAFVPDVTWLALSRVATGFGIGGVLVTTNALAAEFVPAKWRGSAIAVIALGFPAGSIGGGLIASQLIENGGWRDIFHFGAAFTAAMLLASLLLLEESADWLLRKGTQRGRDRAATILRRCGHDPAQFTTLIAPSAPARTGWRDLFVRGAASVTLLTTLALFFHFATSFFLLKWIPKIVVDLGFPASKAAIVLVSASFGGLIGSLILFVATTRLPARPLAFAALVLAIGGVACFGSVPANLVILCCVAGAANMGANAATIALFAIAVEAYPPQIRGAGLGFSMGFGRIGAALGPVAGGFLLSLALPFSVVAIIIAGGSGLAAWALAAQGAAVRRRRG
ncbi:hypothetical protein ATE67_14505 [Sphingopyxis sp. H050]|nr:hypothetical protein ATE67_14505 [Sphingopyxis sp. H050]